MALSSALAPEKIIGRQRPNLGSAQKFISGGNVLGSSVVSSAANKIVGFQRNAGVRPAIPDINSIISSISSNIINNVNNTVNNGTSVVNREVGNKIQNIRTELFQVVKNIENKINSINNLIEQKTELINYINQTNIENKKDILNEINSIDTKISSNRQELIDYISKTNIENKKEVIQLINQNKKDIIVNKTEIIDYINKTVLQSNVVKKVDQLENIITQVKSDVSQIQVTQTPQQNFGGITTQLREVVQNIRENVNETVSKTITNLTTEYRKKVQEVDSAKPTGILQKFIDAYNTAFGFAQFFSNKKNISKLKDNLNAVKESFTESFSTAKLLRQVIVKIVKQLSNLPKATSSGGGGFNIDIDVPGPRLRQSLPRNASRIGRIGKFAALGAGAVGAGIAGGAVVNALSDSGQVQPAVGEPMIPGAIVDGFSAIVERFEKAVEKLAKGATGQKKSEAKSKPPSGGGSKPSSSPGSSPGAMPSGPAVMPESDQELYTLATIAGLESGSAQGQADVAQAVYNRMSKENTSATDILTRTGQFEPAFTAPYKISGGAVDPATKNIKTFEDAVNYRMKKTGEKRQTAEAAVRATIANLQNPSLQQNAASFVGARTSFRANANSYGRLSNSVWRGTSSDNQYLNEEVSGKGTAAVPTFISGGGKPGVTGQRGGMGGPSVDPSQIAPEARSLLATSIAQPPPSQSSEPTVTILPMDMTGGQQPQGGGGVTSPPPQQKKGPSVPFLPSSNPDNFLVLYSKMVYNIVDG